MGVYDILVDGEREGQVKLFRDPAMRVFRPGDEVPPVGEEARSFTFAYSIAMREGGYVNISRGSVFESWTDLPAHTLVVDKWGAPFSSLSKGILGERYVQK